MDARIGALRGEKMKKILLVIAILFCFLQASFAQSPELKNMMPNSWKKLNRLSEQEEKSFIADKNVQEEIIKIRRRMDFDLKSPKEDIRVYQETVNNIIFYRLLYCNIDFNEFLKLDCSDKEIDNKYENDYLKSSVMQFLFIKDKKTVKCIFDDDYFRYRKFFASNGNHESDGGYFFEYSDFMIKALNKKEIGFFRTIVTRYFEFDQSKKDVIKITYPKYKNQLAAANKSDFVKVKASNNMPKLFADGNFIMIEASACLFDPKCPLKYSIQNAFDGNPATSYVENTEDDLMRIKVSAEGVFDKIRLINGYVKNNELYYSNNRIKSVSSEFDSKSGDIIEWGQKLTEKNERFPVQDGIMINQIVNYFTNGYFFVSDIYKGKLYNDTCLAELDFCRKNGNWFFGDIDE